MKKKKKVGKAPSNAESERTDEIEILEVVGLDEDDPPLSERDPDEVEVTFVEAEGRVEPAKALQESLGTLPATEDEVEAQARLLRLRADFENFKKRAEQEKSDYFRHATASLVATLLPVIDNFERALASEPRSDGEGAFRQGVVLIHRQLMEELKKEGLTPMDSVGQPFDPNLHEAVATDKASDLPANTVVEELKRGYFFKDRLLRPAAVRVSLGKSHEAAESGGGEES